MRDRDRTTAATRRRFLRRALLGAGGLALGSKSAAGTLAGRFPDLRRHFIFEYYPWYGGPPGYEHWEYLDRRPPDDIASPFLPRLGAYDVRSTSVLEQHARWIADAGVGSIALSWWGRSSFEHRAAHGVMDVMRAHDIKVTFALEPYANDRGLRFRDDVTFLVREFGEKRGFDCFLVLRNEDGSEGPVFKGFRCIVNREDRDCLGRAVPNPDFTADDVWRSQIEGLRSDLRRDFDHVTLLADSLEFARTPAAGFDGIGIYDNFIPPDSYARLGEAAARAGLLASFNVNPGYLQIEPRPAPQDACYAPRPFAPPTDPLDWTLAVERERAARLSIDRIRESFAAAVAVQEDPRSRNVARGFAAIYINSFNEWHEGHAFEPMRDAADLTEGERRSYFNPLDGSARLGALRAAIHSARTTGPV
jgi:hypothetical protein